MNSKQILIDKEHKGCLWNARRAWKKKTEKPFVMVLTDDVILCDGFLEICDKIVNTHPDKVISLFPVQFLRSDLCNPIKLKSPYISTNRVSGAGIIMPTEFIKPCLDYWDTSISTEDDANIKRWAEHNNITILTTIPSTIQHSDCVSVFNPNRSIGSTDFYDQSPQDIDWSSTFITPWTNIIRR